MIKWIKLTKRIYNKYADMPIFAVGRNDTILNGYLFQSIQGDFKCENDNVYISDVTHIIPEKKL